MVKPKDIKDKLLREMGLSSSIKTGKSFTIPKITTTLSKTPLMRLVEVKYGKGKVIEEILLSGSLSEVARMLGNEVDVTTLSKWIKKLKLRVTSSNLPKCKGCPHYKADNCDYGICPLLIKMEKWELVLDKKKEILG